MTNNDITLYKQHLIAKIMENYNMTEDESIKAFEQSTDYKMLQIIPEFIMHYSLDTTAKEVYDEYNGIPWQV